MTAASPVIVDDGALGTARPPTGSPEARLLADRLRAEFGVAVGVLDADDLGWIAWAGCDGLTVPPEPPAMTDPDRVVLAREGAVGRVWLALRVPRAGGSAAWVALAAFPDDSAGRADWADRALLAWGGLVEERLAIEAASRRNGSPRVSRVAEQLIRRLRVSDAPERFQKRAASALREALGVEVVAWVPGNPREPIIVDGGAHGLLPDACRALARESGDESLRICNQPTGSTPPGLRRFVVAKAGAEGDGGWLVIANPIRDRPFAAEADLLSTVASLIGAQRCNARIYSDLKDLLFGVIRALTAAIDAKDPYTSGHSERVARIAVRIGQELGMTAHEQGDLYLMGLLHDVGKIGVEDMVLKKPGKLTPEEYQQVQAHVRIGVHILSDLKKLHHLLPGVAYHHESFDGSGYPAGLRGDAIPLPARILAVADAFDAMSSSRPYRRRMTPPQIDDVLQKGIGTQWDARVVEALMACRADLEAIRQKGLGESLHQVISETLGRS